MRLSRWLQVSLYPYSIKQIVTLNQKYPLKLTISGYFLKYGQSKQNAITDRSFDIRAFYRLFQLKSWYFELLVRHSGRNICINFHINTHTLIWGYFQNIWQNRIWGLWGQRTYYFFIWDFWGLMRSTKWLIRRYFLLPRTCSTIASFN